jgi:Leucine-rich repeat (LRR) protein
MSSKPIDLSCRDLTIFTDDDSMQKTKSLSLHDNRLSRVTLSCTPLLQKLCLHNNKLKDVSDICRMPQLVWLSMHGNMLETLPEAFGDLRMLQRLSLHNNRLIQLPRSFKNCTKLKALSLFKNNLDGLRDDVFEGWNDCEKLALYQNPNLTQLPRSMAHMTSLRELWMGHTQVDAENDEVVSALQDSVKIWW